MKHYRYLFLICLCLGILASGCTFARNKINVEDFHAKAEKIIPGKTTADETVEIIGSQPSAILELKDERAYVYTFGDGKTGGLNLFIFGSRRTNLGIDSAYFFLDKNNVIKRKMISKNSQDLDWDWWAFGD